MSKFTYVFKQFSFLISPCPPKSVSCQFLRFLEGSPGEFMELRLAGWEHGEADLKVAPPHTGLPSAWGGARTQGGGAVRRRKATTPHNREKCLGEPDLAEICTWFGKKNIFYINL